jgi:hypothetical protein
MGNRQIHFRLVLRVTQTPVGHVFRLIANPNTFGAPGRHIGDCVGAIVGLSGR